ncbi:MAG TPA: ABC transporter permease [Candidatus Hydrogenedens sp.]|nr:ABC transporter permease [Candidatus Hydrogenedens sp.]
MKFGINKLFSLLPELNLKGRLSLSLLILIILSSFIFPVLLSTSYEEQNLQLGAVKPSLTHWFGTDLLGRDLFIRTLYGIRVSFWVGLCATVVALIIGVTYGSLSGYAGGWLDTWMMYIVDILYTMPFTMFVIILMTFFGRNFYLLFIAIGAVEWLTMARIVRGKVMSIKQQEYIFSAKALGFSNFRILFKHVIPNLMNIVIVYTTLTIPQVILLEAFLSFLGLGVQPPMCSLGVLIREGVEVMEEYPWLIVFPGIIFVFTLLLLNLLGDSLQTVSNEKVG